MTIVQQRDALISQARAIAEGAKAADRVLTTAEMDKINEKMTEVRGLNDKIVQAKDSDKLLNALGQLNDGEHQKGDNQDRAKSLGEHFVKHAGSQLLLARNAPGASVSAPEYKAAGDTQVTGGPSGGLLFPQIDTNVVQGYRRPLVVADLCSSGTLSGQSITYFVEGVRDGGFATVPEAGLKPQLHYNFSTVTESLTKIAGFIKLSDEMIDDLAFLVTEINNRLMYDLLIFEENQLLNGDGIAPNLRGILNRSGIQTEAGATRADNVDAIFRSLTKVQVVTGLAADGVVIHPTDYQAIRLSKDGNQQYYGGGPFTGAYGNNGLVQQPGIWGQKTVVTAAIAAGTVLVGAFQQAATVYRRGGVTVSSTNSNVDDFIHNLVTVRAEERLALAVRMPQAFVKLTLGTT
jgi:HK97 family phage major capsid protein